MHKFSVSKYMKKNIDKRREEVAIRKSGGAFMSNTNYQRIQN